MSVSVRVQDDALVLCMFVSNVSRAPVSAVQLAFEGVPYLQLKFLGEPAVASSPTSVVIPAIAAGAFVRAYLWIMYA